MSFQTHILQARLFSLVLMIGWGIYVLASWIKSKCPLYVCLTHAVSSDIRQSTAMPPPAGASLHAQAKLLWILWILWIQSFTEWDAGDYCWSFFKRSVSDKSHITIPVSHDRDLLLSFFHVYWRFQVILWEWLQHSYWIISMGMYILHLESLLYFQLFAQHAWCCISKVAAF